MSRRPVGPCDRNHPFFLDAEELESQRDAPRLPGQSIASKLMVGALLLCCCGTLALGLLFVASLWVSLPATQPGTPGQSAGASVVSIDQRGFHEGRPRHHAQRSVIRRLALLRRAPQGRGVDVDSVRLVFPQWLNRDGKLEAQSAIGDIILALSYLSAEDDPDENGSAARMD